LNTLAVFLTLRGNHDAMSMPPPLFLIILLIGLSGCASLPTELERPVSSHTDRDGKSSRIATYAEPYLRKHPGKSGFWLLDDMATKGIDAMLATLDSHPNIEVRTVILPMRSVHATRIWYANSWPEHSPSSGGMRSSSMICRRS
jgi:hypothetical protein